MLRYSRFEPEERRQPVVAKDYAKWFLARLRTFEVRLAEEDDLCAGRFTAADVSVGYALMLAENLDLSARFTPAVTAYWELVQGRPAFKRALNVQKNAALAQRVSIVPAPRAVP